MQVVERDELVKMEPNISDQAVAALYAPTGAIVCPFGGAHDDVPVDGGGHQHALAEFAGELEDGVMYMALGRVPWRRTPPATG